MLAILVQSLAAGLATTLGAVMVLVTRRLSPRLFGALLGLAVGIMGGVVVLDLLPTAVALEGFGIAIAGFLLGIVMLFILSRIAGGLNIQTKDGKELSHLANLGYLMATGIALHDLPEGMAIAGGYAAAPELGLVVLLAIAFHNIPEGMVSAAPLKMAGLSAGHILGLALLVSIFTPLGTVLGMLLVGISLRLVGVLLAVAAGAMVYLVTAELIPEAGKWRPGQAFVAGLAGFTLMAVLHLAT